MTTGDKKLSDYVAHEPPRNREWEPEERQEMRAYFPDQKKIVHIFRWFVSLVWFLKNFGGASISIVLFLMAFHEQIGQIVNILGSMFSYGSGRH